MTARPSIPTRVEIEVARTNAIYRIDLYMGHYGRCLTDEHCQRCESMLLDAIAAERHFKRRVADAAREAVR